MVRTICLAVLALAMLAGCADTPPHRAAAPAPPAGASAPAESAAGYVRPAPPPLPAPAGPQRTADPIDREVCVAQCERSYRVCMDSASMPNEGTMGMLTEQRLFGPADDCQHQLRQCMPRCSAAR